MHAPINQEALQEKWAPLLDADGQDPIKDAHRRMVTAVLLENQEQTLKERENSSLNPPPTLLVQAVSVAVQPQQVLLLVSTPY